MRSLAYTGPWSMELTEGPDPQPPADWVVVDVIATGICGSDAHGFTGETGRRIGGQVMGHETVGRLRETLGALPRGSLVTINPQIGCGRCEACLRGERQMCPELRVLGVDPGLPGSFADAVAVPEGNVVPLGETTSIAHGALIEPLAVGFHAVMRGIPHVNDRVVVIGGGPIGQAAALGARRAGIGAVLVSEPLAERREMLQQLGFTVTAPDELATAVADQLGAAATLVIDAVGVEATLQDAVDIAAPGARIVLVGMGTRELLLRPYGFSGYERSLIGSYCYSDEHFRSTAEWVAQGRPELDLLIDRMLPLEEGPRAFDEVARGTSGANKTLLLSQPLAAAAKPVASFEAAR